MKHRNLSIHWKIYLYLTGFVAAIILLLWLFQIVFLNDFYKAIKISEVKTISQEIVDHIEDDDLSEIIAHITQENQICIMIIDGSGNIYASIDMLPDCIIHRLSSSELLLFYHQAIEEGGSYLELFSRDIYTYNPYQDGHDNQFFTVKDVGIRESIINTQIITIDDIDYAVILNSTVSPLDATVRTLRIQLLYITGILLVMALLIALFISSKLSKPIFEINRSAKVLAEGDYSVTFDAKGYREIDELNETLNYAAKELSKVEGLRKELIANISHDLRTPLTMIIGYSEILRDIPDENTPENVQIIIDEAKRLTALVNDLLDISKLQSGTQTLQLSRFDLTELINEIVGRYDKLMAEKQINLHFEFEDRVNVNADRTKLSQVIYNLVNNAIHYTGEDKTVTIKQNITDAGKSVLIEIIDSGEGISQEDISHIWERYYKSDKTHKRAVIGTGLGLSIVKTILELHHAEYGVSSKRGKGSTFWFQLPIISSESEHNNQ